MNKIILIIIFFLIKAALAFGQNISNDNSIIKKRNFQFLSKGINIGYRAGIDRKNNELVAGYYFDIIDNKRHRLITFDNDIWTNFNRLGFNSTISYSNDILALSFSTDILQIKSQLKAIPAIGVGFGYNDLFSIGVFYNHKFTSDIDYPTFTFKVIVRPSFINIIVQNPNGSKW